MDTRFSIIFRVLSDAPRKKQDPFILFKSFIRYRNKSYPAIFLILFLCSNFFAQTIPIPSGNKTSGNKANKRNKDKEDTSTTASAKSVSASAKKMNPVKLKSEIRRLDSHIEKLASQKSALEAEMLKTDFYSVNDSAEIALKTKTFSDITAQLEKAEESWLELQEQL